MHTVWGNAAESSTRLAHGKLGSPARAPHVLSHALLRTTLLYLLDEERIRPEHQALDQQGERGQGHIRCGV